MYSDSESDTKAGVLEGGKINSINSLPDKSRKSYERVYKVFMDWKNLNNIIPFSEKVLLSYFEELSKKYKSTSLWAHYSMLRSTLNINHSINIETYAKLRAFLKRRSANYRPKKVKRFTPDQVNRFINEAPDNKYLATKVALIMGMMGACRASELYLMHIDDFQDLGSAILVTVPNTKGRVVRKFTIAGHFYQICKKYIDLRPSNIASTSFFLSYQDGKCSAKNMGINTLGGMGKQIASFLKLPSPEMYTGHNFRRLSDTLLVDSAALNKPAGRTSIPVPIKSESIDEIFLPVNQETSVYTEDTSTTNEANNFDGSPTPSVYFTNCSNITINFITNKSEDLMDSLMAQKWKKSKKI